MPVKKYCLNGTQADRIIRKFEGARPLAAAITAATGQKCDPSRVFRWRMPAPSGTGGIIPAHRVADVKAAARLMGVLLSDSDWSPRTESREDI